VVTASYHFIQVEGSVCYFLGICLQDVIFDKLEPFFMLVRVNELVQRFAEQSPRLLQSKLT
jgi:hypothetical protein